MPELPDVVVYLEHLQRRILHQSLERVRILNPFLLRTFDPPIEDLEGKPVVGLERMGKRLVFAFPDELYLVLHLMIAGRLHWKPVGYKAAGKGASASFAFPTGTLLHTESATKKRASLHVVQGRAALKALNPGGLEVLDTDLATFARQLTQGNHLVKRALTDPRRFSGIGNAYSDEILHAARLSPMKLTSRLTDEEIGRLFHATQATLRLWLERLREDAGDDFPEKVTAFRKGMAVHGRYGEPCPDCGTKVQRIRYADNETNYCPRCQTGGKLLADRSLSRLLKDHWPRTIEEWEEGR